MRNGLKQKLALVVLFVLAVSSLSPHAIGASAASEGKLVTVSLNEGERYFENAPFLKDGSAYLPLREMGQILNAKTTWIPEGKRIVMSHPDVNVELTLGSKETKINGQTITMRTAPLNRDGVVYVPVRFVTQAFGGKVAWNEKKRHVDLTREEPYLFIDYAGTGYWLDRKVGLLHAASGAQATRLIADTAVEIIGNGQIQMESLSERIFVIKVQDNFGEPHLHNNTFKLIVANDKLTLESKRYSYGHPERSTDWSSGMNALLMDGAALYEVNQEGAIVAKHDLQTLTGYEDENFHVEHYDDEYMVVRPDRTGWLTLVNRKTGETVRLAEAVLTKEQWEFYQSRDEFDPEFANWDGLNVISREGNTLKLGHHYFIDGGSSTIDYKLKPVK